MEKTFPKNTFAKRMKTMLAVDIRRMFTTPFFYICLACCFLMPILILVMTAMMDGSVSVDPQTGKETIMEGFDNVWQIIGSVSSTEGSSGAGALDMGLTTMCNINLLYFLISVLVCIFVAGDFRSGYAKNLFTVRAKKTDYVISKTLTCSLASSVCVLAFIIGSIFGGAISSLPFDMEGFNTVNLIMCFLSKLALVSVFVPIYLTMAIIAKNRSWLSICLSMMVGMFLFMMIPMLTPLNATIANPVICLVGGALFSIGLGAIDNRILKKTALV